MDFVGHPSTKIENLPMSQKQKIKHNNIGIQSSANCAFSIPKNVTLVDNFHVCFIPSTSNIEIAASIITAPRQAQIRSKTILQSAAWLKLSWLRNYQSSDYTIFDQMSLKECKRRWELRIGQQAAPMYHKQDRQQVLQHWIVNWLLFEKMNQLLDKTSRKQIKHLLIRLPTEKLNSRPSSLIYDRVFCVWSYQFLCSINFVIVFDSKSFCNWNRFKIGHQRNDKKTSTQCWLNVWECYCMFCQWVIGGVSIVVTVLKSRKIEARHWGICNLKIDQSEYVQLINQNLLLSGSSWYSFQYLVCILLSNIRHCLFQLRRRSNLQRQLQLHFLQCHQAK